MSCEEIEARLKKLEDREEIRRLLHDYGSRLDSGDFEGFSQLFAEQGEWIGGMGAARTPAAIRKLMEETIGRNAERPPLPCRHVFTNEIIELSELDGDRAGAVTTWEFIVQSDAGDPRPFYVGHYEDALVREKGRWKFLKRVVHLDIPASPDHPE